MNEHYIDQWLRSEEELILMIRPSWYRYRWSLGGSFIGLTFAFFLFIPLRVQGFWGFGVFFFFVILACGFLVRTMIVRRRTIVLLSNERLIDIDQRRLFERHVAEFALSDITDVRYYQKGMVATMLHIGSVVIDAPSRRGRMEIRDIVDPARVQVAITDMCHKINKNESD